MNDQQPPTINDETITQSNEQNHTFTNSVEASTNDQTIYDENGAQEENNNSDNEEDEQPQRKKRRLECITCSICNKNESKYTCPGCRLPYCSFPCFSSHKTQHSCTGRRDKTAFVSLDQFSDKNMQSDYHFLEDAKDKKFSSRRIRTLNHVDNHEFQYHPPHVKFLQQKATQKGIHLSVMPEGMSKRKCNTTRFINRENQFLWHVALLFDQVRISDHNEQLTTTEENEANKTLAPLMVTQNGVSERKVLFDVIRRALDRNMEGSDPVIRNRLQKYVYWYEQALRNRPEWNNITVEAQQKQQQESSMTSNIRKTDEKEQKANETNKKEQEKEAVAVNQVENNSNASLSNEATTQEADAKSTETDDTTQKSSLDGSESVKEAEEVSTVDSSSGAGPQSIFDEKIIKYDPELPMDQVPFCCFLRVADLPSNQTFYYRLDLTRTLHENLMGKVVLEYPELHISLPTYAHEYTLVTEDQLMDIKRRRDEKNELRKKRKEEYEQKQARYQQRFNKDTESGEASTTTTSTTDAQQSSSHHGNQPYSNRGGGRGRGRGNFRGGRGSHYSSRGGGYHSQHHRQRTQQ